MALKDVLNYYKVVCNQYSELNTELKDFQKECEQGLIEPERLEQIQESIKPLMQNYERISYIMYLFNQPSRKKKISKYKKANQKFLDRLQKSNSLDTTIQENNEVIKSINTKKDVR